VHDAIPEKEIPLTAAVIAWLNHPFESGDLDVVTVTAGFDASYLNGSLVALAFFPALSVQLPLTVALVVSGPA
jgi:hypothetical protein